MPLVEKGYKKGSTQKALNNYPDNSYELIKAIKKENIYKSNVISRDKYARKFIKEHYRKNINDEKFLTPGQLVMFDYFKPKTEEELEYYDAKPCTIFFGVTKTPEGPRVIGFNLHYYPPHIRYQIMDVIFSVYKSIYLKSWYEPLEKDATHFDVKDIVGQLQKAKLDFGIRMYIPELMNKIIPLPPRAWSKAVFTEGRFKKRIREAIMNYWRQKKEEKLFGISKKQKKQKNKK